MLLLLCLPTLVQAEPEVDRLAAAVHKAEGDFRLGIQKEKAALTKQIKSVLDREIQRAISKGDLDTLESLKAQLNNYETDGTHPTAPAAQTHIKSYKQKLVRLGDNLIKAYETATRRYTQARDVDNARLMKDKINWTRPIADLDTVERRGKHYLLVREKKTWTEAKAACEKLGGYLVCLNSKSEHRFIVKEITEDKNVNVWIGTSDAHQEGNWIWLDGSDDYWPWGREQPDNYRGKQHYGILLYKYNQIDDIEIETKLVTAYICEWDYLPTRETLYQTEASREQESTEIDTLKSATLKHNELIVYERKKLQSAILEADDEATITDAKAGYSTRVASIKQDYIDQLQGVLTTAAQGDRLEIAGKIKTQILRVQQQITQLAKADTQPDVPALDEGGVETTPEPQPPADADENKTPDRPTPDNDGPDNANDPGGFFGLPLE